MSPSRPDLPNPVHLPVLGWREWIALPGLGVDRIKAKLDTGARSSALHATDLERFEDPGGPYLRFTLHPRQRSVEEALRVEARLVDERNVRSSSGARELRPVVLLDLEVAGVRWSAEVTLTRRDRMGFRMLLGRTALRGRFLVDPGRSFAAPSHTPPRGESE